jgi:radical SAM protein with 4Fe4S-binding SPASM domain
MCGTVFRILFRKTDMEDIGRWIIERDVPIYSTIEVTWRCNLRCIHCDMEAPKKDKEELSTEEIKDILRQLVEEGSLFLTLTGGEPLLREDLWEILDYAKTLKFFPKIITNGTQITEEYADRIKTIGLSGVDISLYGVTAEVHDAITGVPGSFEKTKEAIRLLKERDIKINLLTMLMKDNFFQLQELKQSAEDLGVEYNINPVLFPRRDGSKEPFRFRINDEQLKEYLKDRLPHEEYESVKDLERPGLCAPHCNFGRLYCVIDAYGSVYPCIARTRVAGNLRKESVRKIWRESEELKAVRSITDKNLKECYSCEYKSICNRCPALAYAENGSYMGPSTEACRISKLIMEEFNGKKEEVSTA